MRAQLERPCIPQHQIHGNDGIVRAGSIANEEPLPEPESMIRRVALARASEERQVPILGHVPVEAVQAVDDAREHPRAVQARTAGVVLGRVREIALQRAKDNDGERGRVLGRVGEVLPAPADLGGIVASPHADVLDQALPEPNQIRCRHDQWDEDPPPAAPVGPVGGAARRAVEEHHADAHEEVAHDFGVGRQDIGEDNVAEFAIARLRQTADADAPESGEQAAAARV